MRDSPPHTASDWCQGAQNHCATAPSMRSEEALWREMEDAEAALESLRPSPEALRQEAAEAERLAHEHGVPPKSRMAVVSLSNKWNAFLTVHGEEYGFDESVRRYAACFDRMMQWHRSMVSTVGFVGMKASHGRVADKTSVSRALSVCRA